mmetsp:Transcript_6526/g.12002  ORF Transcript_6526/g.12002 Transcript_6526/m.12002 type:complete len:287 (+) Transcript_6526:461-1321(+)
MGWILHVCVRDVDSLFVLSPSLRHDNDVVVFDPFAAVYDLPWGSAHPRHRAVVLVVHSALGRAFVLLSPDAPAQFAEPHALVPAGIAVLFLENRPVVELGFGKIRQFEHILSQHILAIPPILRSRTPHDSQIRVRHKLDSRILGPKRLRPRPHDLPRGVYKPWYHAHLIRSRIALLGPQIGLQTDAPAQVAAPYAVRGVGFLVHWAVHVFASREGGEKQQVLPQFVAPVENGVVSVGPYHEHVELWSHLHVGFRLDAAADLEFPLALGQPQPLPHVFVVRHCDRAA